MRSPGLDGCLIGEGIDVDRDATKYFVYVPQA